MTSFTEILNKAREEAKNQIKKLKEVVEDTSVIISEENNNNIPEITEDKNSNKSDTPILTLGDAIIKQSSEAVIKFKKIKGTNASRRIAKSIASKQISHNQLKKALKIQERFGDRRPDFHLVGSYALQTLGNLLDKGVSLSEALNSHYKKD